MRFDIRLPLLAAALFVLSPAPAEAGIIVLKNGKVIIGDIDEAKETEEEIKVVFKKKPGEAERGETLVPRHRVRWYTRDSDALTDEYWEKHENDEIDDAYFPLREKWRLRQKAKAEDPQVEPIDPDPKVLEEGLKNPTKPETPAPVEEPAAPAPKPQPKSGCGQACALTSGGTAKLPNGLWLGAVFLGLLALRRRLT